MDLWVHSELSIRWNFSSEVIEKAIQRHRDSAGGIFKILLIIEIFSNSSLTYYCPNVLERPQA